MKMRYTIVLALSAAFCVTAAAQDVKFEKRVAETGLPGVELTEEESTAAVSVITADQIGHRTTKNIGNSIIGQGQGLISLQGAGNVSDMNPTFYVRGLQTLNGNSTPLVLIDGIERPITSVSAEEVESVSILKDAAVYRHNVLMNANLFYLGAALFVFGLFNVIFVSKSVSSM